MTSRAVYGPHSTGLLEAFSRPAVQVVARELIPLRGLLDPSQHFSSSAVLYICRKRLLAESSSLSGSRGVLVGKLRVLNRISTQIFPMMPQKVIDHLALAIAQDPVISAITGNPVASSMLMGLSCMATASFLPILSYKGVKLKVSLARCQPARRPVGCRSQEPDPDACPEALGSGSGTSRGHCSGCRGLVHGVCVATSLSGASRWGASRWGGRGGECRVGAY